MKIRTLLLRMVRPLNEWIDRRSRQGRVISGEDYQYLRKYLRPGDVLCTYTKGNLTNWIIPGDFKHVGMYVGSEEVVEAVLPTLRKINLLDFILKTDKLVVVRPKGATLSQRKAAALIMEKMVGRPYDLEFEPGDDEFYCSEAVQVAYSTIMGGMFKFKKRYIMGVMTVLPNDFVAADQHFEKFWDSREG